MASDAFPGAPGRLDHVRNPAAGSRGSDRQGRNEEVSSFSKQKDGRGGLTAKQAPPRPGPAPPRRSVCAPEQAAAIIMQTEGAAIMKWSTFLNPIRLRSGRCMRTAPRVARLSVE